jgi:hypothetical protein
VLVVVLPWSSRRRASAAARRAHELLLQLGVPIVLDVVVRPARQLRRDDRPPEFELWIMYTALINELLIYVHTLHIYFP